MNANCHASVGRVRSWAVILLGCLIAVGASAAGGKPDVADEASPFSSVPADALAKMQAQAPLARAANEVRNWVHARQAAGFAGLALEEQAVVLYWKGLPPQALNDVIAHARRTAPVTVRAASYSRDELERAVKPLAAMMRADRNSPIHMINIAVDGSGVELVTDRTPAEAAAYAPALGVPVQYEVMPRIQLASRYADTPPYWGGAAIINTDFYNRCTAGFGVIAGSTRYLLTAGHCGRPGSTWQNGDLSRTIGTSTAENVAHDLLLIPTSAGSYIYDGGVNTGEFTKGVAGWDWVYAGEYVCQSGSTSGAVCGMQNTGNVTYQFCSTDIYGNRECYNDLILARKTDGGTASRPGDSGGPVFTLVGSTRVMAKGTVTGYGGDSNCSSCRLIYQDFGTAWRDFGIVPLTAY